MGRAEGALVVGAKGEARKRQSLKFTASFMSPPRQCEGYNARVISLCFSKGCVYTVQTPGENPTLYTGKGIQRQESEGETEGRTWGGRVVLRDKREWGGDKQGWRRSIYKVIVI